MTWTSHARRPLAVPASILIAVGGMGTATGLLSPQHASALATCPVLALSPITYSTGEHCFTVPANVSSVHAVLIGGTGGAGVDGTATPVSTGAGIVRTLGVLAGGAGLGGHGMQVTGDVAVSAGQAIWVYVGGNGGAGESDSGSGGAGGYNGGGQGGGGNSTESSVWAGGGGGATDLRTSQSSAVADCAGTTGSGNNVTGAPGSMLLVAGGGGGGGNGADVQFISIEAPVSTTPDGGDGGSQPGDSNPPSAGTNGLPDGGDGGGQGTSSAGGAGGAGNGSTTHDGQAGQTRGSANPTGCGGPGGNANDGQTGGGGGGGGYNGGGGGGAGASLCAGLVSCINLSNTQMAGAGGSGGGGGGSDFHSGVVTNPQEAIATVGPSATISFTVPATPTQSLQPLITTPSVGSGGSSLDVGIWLLGLGGVLLAGVAVGRRRSGSGGTPRPPA